VCREYHIGAMVTTRKQALDVAGLVKVELERIYGPRLRGVYLYGSAARGQLNEDSDIDIAIVLDNIPDRFAEHERISELGSQVSLAYKTLVSFFLTSDSDFDFGRCAIHRAIKEEGIKA